MRCFQKLSWQKLYLPRQEWKINETLIFFQIWDVFKNYTDLVLLNGRIKSLVWKEDKKELKVNEEYKEK